MQKLSSDSFLCLICNYQARQSHHITNHIEAKHMQSGHSYQCDQCDQVCPTKNALNAHKSRKHRKRAQFWYFVIFNKEDMNKIFIVFARDHLFGRDVWGRNIWADSVKDHICWEIWVSMCRMFPYCQYQTQYMEAYWSQASGTETSLLWILWKDVSV